MRLDPTHPFPPGQRILNKGLSDWMQNPIDGIKDFNKGIKEGDLDRLATPPMVGDVGRPSVAINYAKATFDPMGSPYSYSDSRFAKKGQKPEGKTPPKSQSSSRSDSYLRQAAAQTQTRTTTGRTLLNQ